MELKKYKLGEIADIIGGVNFEPTEIEPSGIRILRGGNIQNHSINLKDDDVFLPAQYENSINQIQVGDTIVVASTGSVEVLGKAATCFEAIPKTQIGAFLRLIRPKEPQFAMLISIAVNSEHFRKYIRAQAKGTSINNINLGHLNSYEFNAPTKSQKMSSFYYNIETKIALNRAINQNLEKMAKQLYDYWFVQFDFPNEEGKPYKSSGGKMVWNEKLKREVPKGWVTKTINEVCTCCRGVSYGKDDLLPNGNGVLVLRGNNIENNHIVYDSNVAFVPYDLINEEQRIKEGDIVMTMSSGSKAHVGKCALFYKDSKHTFGAFLSKFTPKNEMRYMIFMFFTSEYFKSLITAFCNGTGINNLTNQTFDNVILVLPNENILQQFESKVKPLFSIIGSNEENIEVLTKQRDELLPLLMNGQISPLNCD